MSESVALDPSTGLPALPEGHYFGVEDSSITIWQEEPYGDFELHSWLRGRKPNLDKLTEKIKRAKHWGEGYSAHRGSRVELRVEKDNHDGFFKVWYTQIYLSMRRDTQVFGEVLDEYTPVTKANLLERATTLYLGWLEYQENEALQGFYPPNKFTPEGAQ